MEVGLVQYLKQQQSLMDLIGKTGNVTICPIPAPDDLAQYPLVTYQAVSYVDAEEQDDGSTWVAEERIVFNCWSQAAQDGGTYLQASTIRAAVRAALSGYAGDLPDGTHVFLTRIDGKEDFFESGSRQYRATLHVLVQYAEG